MNKNYRLSFILSFVFSISTISSIDGGRGNDLRIAPGEEVGIGFFREHRDLFEQAPQIVERLQELALECSDEQLELTAQSWKREATRELANIIVWASKNEDSDRLEIFCSHPYGRAACEEVLRRFQVRLSSTSSRYSSDQQREVRRAQRYLSGWLDRAPTKKPS